MREIIVERNLSKEIKKEGDKKMVFFGKKIRRMEDLIESNKKLLTLLKERSGENPIFQMLVKAVMGNLVIAEELLNMITIDERFEESMNEFLESDIGKPK